MGRGGMMMRVLFFQFACVALDVSSHGRRWLSFKNNPCTVCCCKVDISEIVCNGKAHVLTLPFLVVTSSSVYASVPVVADACFQIAVVEFRIRTC